METRKIFYFIVEEIRVNLQYFSFIAKHKKRQQDFTRDRNLTFPLVFLSILKNNPRNMFNKLRNMLDSLWLWDCLSTGSAMSQARGKISHTAFIEINEKTIIPTYYKHANYKKWKWFRVTAVDGSKIRLPDTKEIYKEFPPTNIKNAHITDEYSVALLSCRYDVLNQLVIEGYLTSSYVWEREILIEHVKQAEEKDIFLCDRGYPSYATFAMFESRKKTFVMRCARNFNKEAQALFDPNCEIERLTVTLKPTTDAKKEMKEWVYKDLVSAEYQELLDVTFIRIVLDNGDIEVLVTNIPDHEKYSNRDFKELYNARRWVETNYGHLKTRLEVENFSWKSTETVKQEVFASILLMNLEAIMSEAVNEEMAQESQKKELENTKQVNKAVSYNYVKENVLNEILFSDKDPREILQDFETVVRKQPSLKKKWRHKPRNKVSWGKKVTFLQYKKKRVT